ncbi:MAG TPA: family 10 glycosylhydrolase [Defluviitaleaceae bacterium]|nr:family 10 glycosylhydrolase [Defluviitaleaceae bacterium]
MGKIKIFIRNFMIFTLLLSLSFSSISLSYASNQATYVKNAESLKALGLFLGTDKGFELDRKSTRAEAAAMLVRLLGAEKTAAEEYKSKPHPFADVPAWASPAVSYLYNKGLTFGISGNLYGAKDEITPEQYMTFLLRALGYSDRDGDFHLNNVLDFAHHIGMINDSELSLLKAKEKTGVLRDYIVMMSYNCLFTKMKNENKSLLIHLAEKGVISNNKLKAAARIDSQLKQLLMEEAYLDENNEGNKIENSIEGEVRGVWISYLELQNIFPNKTEAQFKESIRKMFRNIKDAGLNTVFVQVRPFGDAIYPSSYFPWSYIISGTEGVNPYYDPLEIMVNEAHLQGLKIEAWINPYRIRNNNKPLSADNKALEWLNDGSNRMIKINSGIYYNPASKDVQNLIVKGIEEIIQNYDVDGIHFDDYFYPTTDMSFDAADYQKYLQEGGYLSQAGWRRENVNQLVREVYKTIKAYDPDIKFGISPQGIISRNYNNQYIDVEKWLSNSGYIDYICPQVYFGFNHSNYPYDKVVQEWNQLIKNSDVDLYIGLAAYKLGQEDAWAGNGKNEWIGTSDILSRMIEEGRKSSNYKGFILFRYDSLWNPSQSIKDQVDAERIHLINCLD